jgi:hypothetical protein
MAVVMSTLRCSRRLYGDLPFEPRLMGLELDLESRLRGGQICLGLRLPDREPRLNPLLGRLRHDGQGQRGPAAKAGARRGAARATPSVRRTGSLRDMLQLEARGRKKSHRLGRSPSVSGAARLSRRRGRC